MGFDRCALQLRCQSIANWCWHEVARRALSVAMIKVVPGRLGCLNFDDGECLASSVRIEHADRHLFSSIHCSMSSVSPYISAACTAGVSAAASLILVTPRRSLGLA